MIKLKTSHAAAAVLISCISAPSLSNEVKECSLSTLRGSYVFAATGFSQIGGVWQPKAVVERLVFNGDGTLSVTHATAANAQGNGAVVQFPPGGLGSYLLDTDCKGTLQFAAAPVLVFDIFVNSRGHEFWMIQTAPNNVLQGLGKRVR